jgi:glycosyltransferase involved in cell wall biosynthesis
VTRFSRPISAFIVCRNEARVLGPCLESLDFCREIVVVDSGSKDGTLALIESFRKQGFPIRLIEREWPGFAAQKQFAMEACKEPWRLSLDADERLDERLKSRLAALDLDGGGSDAYALRRRDYLPGYGYPPAGVHAKAFVRLVRGGAASFDLGRLVHESLVPHGRPTTLEPGAILHFRNLTAAREIQKAASYAALKAREQHVRGRRAGVASILFKPLGRFLSCYVLQRYFLCGMPGLIHAAILAQYAFLTEAELYRLSLPADEDASGGSPDHSAS